MVIFCKSSTLRLTTIKICKYICFLFSMPVIVLKCFFPLQTFAVVSVHSTVVTQYFDLMPKVFLSKSTKMNDIKEHNSP